MDAFNSLISIVFTGLAATVIALFIAGSLAYWVRSLMGYRDPNLGWDPTAGMSTSWSNRRTPDLDTSDWAERAGLRRD